MKAKIKKDTRISVYGWDCVTCKEGEIVDGDLAVKAVKLKLAKELTEKEAEKAVVTDEVLRPDETKPDAPEETKKKKGWLR